MCAIVSALNDVDNDIKSN